MMACTTVSVCGMSLGQGGSLPVTPQRARWSRQFRIAPRRGLKLALLSVPTHPQMETRHKAVHLVNSPLPPSGAAGVTQLQ